MAAARASDVSFLVSLAGPVHHFRAGFLHELNASLQKAGLDKMQRKALRSLWTRYFEDAGDGYIEPPLLADIRIQKEIVAEEFIPPDTTAYPPESNPHPRSFWYLHRLSIFENLGMPVFIVLGENDQLVPEAQTTSIVKEAFEMFGKSNYKIHVFPKASHSFVTPDGQLVSRFFETQIDWVLQQAGIR